MKQEQSLDLSDEQVKMLVNEAFIAEVIKARQPPVEEAKPKPRWLLILESSGGVALITVLLGGIFGSIITGRIQYYQKEREFQQAWLKTRGDIALADAKEYRERELELVSKTYELVGRCIAVSDNLIYLNSPVFDPDKYAVPSDIEKQQLTMMSNYNACDKEWRETGEKLKLLMNYYHQGRPEVSTAWRNVQQAVTDYMGCAHKWYVEHNSPTDTGGVCKPQRDAYTKRVDELNASLNLMGQSVWEGWEPPERMRAASNKAR